MELESGIFAAKLRELGQEYGRLQSRIQRLQTQNSQQLHRVRERLEAEYHAHDLQLAKTARTCRCPSMAHLAEIQRDYGQRTEQLLPDILASGNTGQDRAECHGAPGIGGRRSHERRA